MLTGAEIGTVFTALSLVYQSFSKVKSNKERCRRVLERCQMIVDRLQDSRRDTDDNGRLCERIDVLESTFVRAANAISKVGQQSWLKSLLNSEENTFLIDDTQHELTNLVTVLNLEQTIDFSAWQKEYETARLQDHRKLMSVGRRLEMANVSILAELSRQGASLAQLTEAMKSLRLTNGTNSSAIAADDEAVRELLDESVPRPRAHSAPASSLSIRSDRNAQNSVPARTPTAFTNRRPSWIHKIHIPSFTSLVPRISPRNSPPASAPGSPNISPGAPRTPPPAYNAIANLAASEEDVTNVSVVAVHSPDSPPLAPSPSSPWPGANEEPVPIVKKVRFAIQDVDLRTSELSATGPYGYLNRRVLVELWNLPKHLSFRKPVPFSHFVPVESENIAVVEQKAADIRKSLRPMMRRGNSDFNIFTHVFMLCPKDGKPLVVQMKKNQPRPQKSVKAYIIDSPSPVTVMSVKFGNEKELFVIPYCPDMSVIQLKACMEKYFNGRLSVKSVRMSKCDTSLSDHDSLSLSGLKPFANQLRMTMRTAPT